MADQQSVDATEPSDQQLFEAAMHEALKVTPADTLSAPPEEKPEVKAAPAAAPPEAPPTPAEDPLLPKLKKLMAKEAEVRAFEEQRKAIEAENQKLKSEYEEVKRYRERAAQDPVSAITAMVGREKLAEIAKQLWYESLGDQAPLEYKATKSERTALSLAEQKISEFELRQKQLAEQQLQYQQEAAVSQYRGSLVSYAKEVPDAYQLTKTFAQQDPARVSEVMFKIATEHARKTGGEVLSPEQTVKELEARLAQLKSAVSPGTESKPPETKAPPQAPDKTSLRNKDSATQTTLVSKDDLDDEVLYERALAAARAARERNQ